MVWTDPSSSTLLVPFSPFSTCVVFHHTQTSPEVLHWRRKRVVMSCLCRGWNYFQFRVFILFFWKSVFLTLLKPQTKSNCVSLFPSPIDGFRFISHICFVHSNFHIYYMRNRDPIKIWDPGVTSGDSIVWVMRLGLHLLGYCCILESKLNEGLINRRQYIIDNGQLWILKNILTTLKWNFMVIMTQISVGFDVAHVTLLIEFVQGMGTIGFILVAMILHMHSQELSTMFIQIHRFLSLVVDGVGRSMRSHKVWWPSLVSRVFLNFIKKIFSKDVLVEKLFVNMSKNITKSRFVIKTLVRKN